MFPRTVIEPKRTTNVIHKVCSCFLINIALTLDSYVLIKLNSRGDNKQSGQNTVSITNCNDIASIM